MGYILISVHNTLYIFAYNNFDKFCSEIQNIYYATLKIFPIFRGIVFSKCFRGYMFLIIYSILAVFDNITCFRVSKLIYFNIRYLLITVSKIFF